MIQKSAHPFYAILLIYVCLFTTGNARAERTPPIEYTVLLDDFAAREITAAEGVLKYREAFIQGKDDSRPVLVIYLHGASGRGNDNTRQLRQHGVHFIHAYMKRNSIRGYIIVPQCPADRRWTGGRDGSPFTEPVKQLIRQYLNKGLVDKGRVYILGASMGGGGVWRLIEEIPGVFASALVASGDYRGRQYNSLAKTPAYITVGETEGAQRVQSFRRLSECIANAGGEARLDVLPGLDHAETCAQSFSDKRLDWLFGHKKDVQPEKPDK